MQKINVEDPLHIESRYYNSLDDSEKPLFISQMNQNRKNSGTGRIICLLLGGIGGHHFYFGNWFMGTLYLTFCWTIIPAIFALFELIFLIGMYSDDYNRKIINKVYEAIKANNSTNKNIITDFNPTPS